MKDQKFWIRVVVAVVAVVGVCAVVMAFVKTRKAKLSTAFECKLDFDEQNQGDDQAEETVAPDSLPEVETCDGIQQDPYL